MTGGGFGGCTVTLLKQVAFYNDARPTDYCPITCKSKGFFNHEELIVDILIRDLMKKWNNLSF